ncbi:MAG: FtsB family cell division protein [Thermodesulfobacteriota bacterium]
MGTTGKDSSGNHLWGKGAWISWSLEAHLGWRFWGVWALIVLGFVFLSWMGENGLKTAIRLRQQRTAQERENAILRQSNERLRQEIRLIQQDPALLEWLAKERLGMIGDNERLYIFP